MTRHPTALIVLAAVLTLALRAPWLDAAFGRDEGGIAYVAQAWHHSAPFTYGPYFLDRPPLLVALYRFAVWLPGDDAVGVRLLAAVAAAATLCLASVMALRLGGRRASGAAAIVAAAALSSWAIMSVFAPAELLATVPSCGSVLLLVTAIEREDGALWRLAGAGLLAGLALMLKQSFGDALFAGVATLVVAALLRSFPRRELLRRLGAYAAGAATVFVALVIFELLAHTADDSVFYAVVGFRLDAAHALESGPLFSDATGLVKPAIGSGLVVGVPVAVAGIASLRGRRLVTVALSAWLAAGLVGIMLGGSYWPHYLIEIVPVTAVGAGLAVARWDRAGAVAAALVAVIAVAFTARAIGREYPERYEAPAVAVGDYVRLRAEPRQTMYVMYAHANVLYYAGLPSPFGYHWSLMMRAIPKARTELRALLASPRRPTWVVEWQKPRAFKLDRSGATALLLQRHYRQVGRVCGRPVLLARGAKARPAPARVPPCEVRT